MRDATKEEQDILSTKPSMESHTTTASPRRDAEDANARPGGGKKAIS